MEEKKQLYRFIKVYNIDDKDEFFIYTTRAKDVSTAISKLRNKLKDDESRIGKIVQNCGYVQIKTGSYTKLEIVFERSVLQNNFDAIMQKKIDNFLI